MVIIIDYKNKFKLLLKSLNEIFHGDYYLGLIFKYRAESLMTEDYLEKTGNF